MGEWLSEVPYQIRLETNNDEGTDLRFHEVDRVSQLYRDKISLKECLSLG
jgi:hypothetical protein